METVNNGGLKKSKLRKMQVLTFTPPCFGGAAHSQLIPLLLYQPRGEREKPSSLILHEYICSVYV